MKFVCVLHSVWLRVGVPFPARFLSQCTDLYLVITQVVFVGGSFSMVSFKIFLYNSII